MPATRITAAGSTFGGEFEAALCELAQRVAAGVPADSDGTVLSVGSHSGGAIPRLKFRVPDRGGLPPLNQYATLQLTGGARRVVGYTEASRGCKHRCRHCPVVPIYDGRFRVVQPEVVLEDIQRQVDAGARHITFGDPDFFNAPKAALALVESVARRFPGVSYDVTIKIEHLLRHAAHLPKLRDTGCLFVTSAVESVDDRVLRLLDKGHTRGDFHRAVGLCRASGVVLVPTFVAFTPWTTLEGYCELLSALEGLDLVEHVAPVQLAIRLLIPSGSRLLELEEIRRLIGPFDPATLAYPWRHPEPRVDRLQEEVTDLVGVRLNAPRTDVFRAIRRLAHHRAGLPLPARVPEGAVPRATVPYLNEPWYC